MSWKNYFLNGSIAAAEVHFTTARKLKDYPAAIGGLNANVCYKVYYYTGRKTWSSYADSAPPTIEGLPGDPQENEINVYRVLFLFNDAGEIINRNGDVVGKLVCYFSNECGGY
jgi:hypothetical protein